MMNGSEALKEVMATKELPVTEVAKQCGVHPATVSRWLAGKSTPDDEQKILLARHFGIGPALWLRERMTPEARAALVDDVSSFLRSHGPISVKRLEALLGHSQRNILSVFRQELKGQIECVGEGRLRKWWMKPTDQ